MLTTESSLSVKPGITLLSISAAYVTPTANWALPKTALNLAGLKPGIHFLDVASGSGALYLPARYLGAKVHAVDIFPVTPPRPLQASDKAVLQQKMGRVDFAAVQQHKLFE